MVDSCLAGFGDNTRCRPGFLLKKRMKVRRVQSFSGFVLAQFNSVATMILCFALSTVPYCRLIIPRLSFAKYVLLGVVGSVTAVFGDLIESLMKRAGEIKVVGSHLRK